MGCDSSHASKPHHSRPSHKKVVDIVAKRSHTIFEKAGDKPEPKEGELVLFVKRGCPIC